jgi:hypothetical protein
VNDVLGETREQEDAAERGRWARLLKSAPWCADEARAHEGYCRDAFRALIDSEREPIAGGRDGAERHAWRRLVFWSWRALIALQAQRARLNVRVSVDDLFPEN